MRGWCAVRADSCRSWSPAGHNKDQNAGTEGLREYLHVQGIRRSVQITGGKGIIQRMCSATDWIWNLQVTVYPHLFTRKKNAQKAYKTFDLPQTHFSYVRLNETNNENHWLLTSAIVTKISK